MPVSYGGTRLLFVFTNAYSTRSVTGLIVVYGSALILINVLELRPYTMTIVHI